MTALIESVWNQIHYVGDACHPEAGEHDLRKLVAHVVCRLPEDIRDWLLCETHHLFVGGQGQLGEYIPLHFSPHTHPEKEAGYLVVRMIFLSERLAQMPKDEAFWTIAHEIAHSRSNHDSGGFDAECTADALVAQWGFPEPAKRGSEREAYKLPHQRKKDS